MSDDTLGTPVRVVVTFVGSPWDSFACGSSLVSLDQLDVTCSLSFYHLVPPHSLPPRKKKSVGSVEEKRALIEPEHPTINLARQCELVGLARSSYYYQPVPESQENLLLMRLLDEQYTRTPFYGIKKMTAWLRTQGHEVNHKRVARLLRQMGLMAIYPGPRVSQPGEQSGRYPYLLRGMSIDRVNQVWSTDITYIRLQRGFLYLVAIIDWFSRYVLAWRTSITLETAFCLEALDQAFEERRPEIFNTTRDRSLPVQILLVASKQQGFASVGMAEGEHWTIFSSKDSGEASSMRRCISRIISRSLRQKEA